MATIRIDTQRVGNEISKYIYGHFWEQFHRCIYGGIYDPKSPLSNEKGYRTDVIEALKKINTPMIRWPGGNFVSSYNWEDGVGPRDERPVKYDPNWRVDESNQFGTDEFLEVCEAIGADPLLVLNIGDGSVREASSWVEYCNYNGDSFYAQKRKENGRQKPYNVGYWGLGNEVGWKHQVCARLSVEDYIKDVINYARSIKYIDPNLMLVACGLGLFHGKRGAEWNYKLLMEAGEWFDYLSVHDYFHGGFSGPRRSYEEIMNHLPIVENELKGVAGQVKLANNVLKKEDPIHITFDEWNLLGWADGGVSVQYDPVEDNDNNANYTLMNALYVGNMLNIFQRMSDSIKMAHYSPTVNGRGFIYVDNKGIILRPAYHVFSLYSNYTGTIKIDSFVLCDQFAGVPILDVSSSLNPNNGKLSLAVVNKSPVNNVETDIELVGINNDYKVAKELVVNGANGLNSYNDKDHPDDVKLMTGKEITVKDGKVKHSFQAHSVTVLIFEL